MFRDRVSPELVIDILTELILGKWLNSKDGIQIPALLRVNQRNDCWKFDDSFHVYTGWRFECTNETDIFLPSFFPKLQVRMMTIREDKIQLWAHGLLFTDNRIQVMICMDDINQQVDILIRGELGSESDCYSARSDLIEKVTCELQKSSAGTSFKQKAIRPLDIRNCKTCMTTYDYCDLRRLEQEGKTMTSSGEMNKDSIQELLYCNSRPSLPGEECKWKLV